MSTSNLKGQFLQGDAYKIKKPSKHKQVFFSTDMPRMSPDFRYDGHSPNRQGAYTSG